MTGVPDLVNVIIFDNYNMFIILTCIPKIMGVGELLKLL